MNAIICLFPIGCLSVTALLNFVQPAVLMLFRFLFFCELFMHFKFAFLSKGRFSVYTDQYQENNSTTMIRIVLKDTKKGMQSKLFDFIRKNNQDSLVVGKCSP